MDECIELFMLMVYIIDLIMLVCGIIYHRPCGSAIQPTDIHPTELSRSTDIQPTDFLQFEILKNEKPVGPL